MTQVDVLIVGAGPAGYMLANALSHFGISKVLIIDKRDKRVSAGQADGIQPRTIEIFQGYGLAQRLLAEANYMCMAAMYNPDPNGGGIRCTERLPDITAPDARWPHELTLHQGGIEAIFVDSMRSRGLEVRFSTTVAEMELDQSLVGDPSAHAVKAKLVTTGTDGDQQETQMVQAKFAVGCDGAHSWVRRWMGHEMEGEQTDIIWGVMDGKPQTDFPDWRCKSPVHSEHGSCVVLPRENNSLRLYIQLDSSKGGGGEPGGRVDRSKYRLEDIQESAKQILRPYHITYPEIDWWTIYVIGQRVASAYSKSSRVFIAGDACHTHSPKAGQGANSSMGDTHNLAWKLFLTLKGLSTCHETLLGTYELERRKFAQDLIDFDKEFSSLVSGKPLSETHPEGVSHEKFVEAFTKFGSFSSGIGIRYEAYASGENVLLVPPTVEEQSLAKHVCVGQRVPTSIVIKAGDGRPMELHDTMPTNGSFRVLIWAGDVVEEPKALEAVKVASSVLSGSVKAHTPKGQAMDSVIDILTISTSKTETQFLQYLPLELRLGGDMRGWEKVYCDQPAYGGRTREQIGGKAFEHFGIAKDQGAIIVVRPDGHVSLITSIASPEKVRDYFGRFLKRFT
ncbi:hypothetical protein IE53DRAFT_383511 [Violaceomyces palustris]|uniref:Uncharacterized protein n=1 Tax=Violaceomyces palustris TaxID=1673888 RepID=A0ACD0P7E8_9BASI|nr:hypothetical protein IE53DRAFT_383511 [Violaceomyces palustris]